MAFHLVEKFADLSPVAASGVATAELPNGGTYHCFYLQCLDGGSNVSVANIKADITNIRLTLNGVNYVEMSANLAFDLYDMFHEGDGATLPAGVLPIVLSPMALKEAGAMETFGYGMGGNPVLQLEISFGASIGTAGHIDQVQVYAERVAETRPLGLHQRVTKFERNFASSGTQEISDLPREGGDKTATTGFYLTYDGSSAVIKDIEVIANNQTVIKLTPALAQTLVEKAGRKWTVSGAADDVFPIPFDLFNNTQGFLPHKGLNDLRLKVEWSAAPNSYTIHRTSVWGIGEPNR